MEKKRNGRGRPPKDMRMVRVLLYAEAHHKALWEERAQEAGLPLSSWMRLKLLSGDVFAK